MKKILGNEMFIFLSFLFLFHTFKCYEDIFFLNIENMILNDASIDEIKLYIEQQDEFRDVNVNILGVSYNRNVTFALIQWEQDSNIRYLRGICSRIINRRGVDITHRYINQQTNYRGGVLSKLRYRYRKHQIPMPRIINMGRYGGIRHNKQVRVLMHNIFMVGNGVGVLRFTS
jgi:hypothetical protein